MARRGWGIGLAAVAWATLQAAGATEGWRVEASQRLPGLESVRAEAVETIARHDFTEGVENWRPRSESVEMQRVDEGYRSQGALAVRGAEPSGWNFVWSPTFDVEEGVPYRASMWVRRNAAPEGSAALFFKVEMHNTDPKRATRSNSERIAVDDIGRWHELVVEFIAPEGCDRVALALEKGSNDPVAVDATIDAFRFERLAELSIDARMKTATLLGPIEDALVGVHPRLYMDAAKLEGLRKETREDPRWRAARKTLLYLADRSVRAGPPDYDDRLENYDKKSKSNEQLWQRPVGNLIPEMAMAYLLTGEKKYLDGAKQWVFASLDYPTWGLGGTNNMDLAAGHQFAGIGLAYDWLYGDLTPEERRTIREKLLPRGNTMTRGAESGPGWWRHSYMQNHQWVSVGGLATAAFAICDDAPEAKAWVHLAHDKFATTLDTLGDDGASHEGYGYWEYGCEYIMRYMELARDMLGIDLYRSGGVPHPWLKNNALYAMHLATPIEFWDRRQCVIDMGDCPRHHWYGPSYLLRNQARRFAGSPEASLAQWLAREIEDRGVDATASGHYLNLVWFDPALPEKPQADFPTLHHFEDLGIVSARSSWDGPATHLLVKCGPPLGHKHVDSPRDYGAGHVHPDCGHITLVRGGDFILRDDGYVHPKSAATHNTLLVDGQGQKGGGKDWFRFQQWVAEPGAPRILEASSAPDRDTVVCDPTEAYPKELGLKQWTRRIEFHKPGRLVVVDEATAESPVQLEWRFMCEGPLTDAGGGRFTTTSGQTRAELAVESPDAVQAHRIEVASGRHEGHAHDCLSVKTKGKVLKARLTTTIVLDD